MSGRIPDNYEKVDDRIKSFRKDYPGAKGQIVTFDNKTEKAIFWEARISVWVDDAGNGHPGYALIAIGHTYDPWGQSSQYEKSEKAAIGRALVMAGYASLSEPSIEEMDLHNARPSSGNGPDASVVAPTRNETRPSGVIPPKRQNSAPVASPEQGAATVDRAAFRPSYVVVIKKAEDLVEQGKTQDELKAFFAARKKGMNAEEYQDSLLQFGRLKLAIEARDAALVAEATDEYNAQAEADMAAEF